jgi:hypothetical protein
MSWDGAFASRYEEWSPPMTADVAFYVELHIYHGRHLGLLTEAAELAPVVDRFLRRGGRPTR